MEAWKNDLSGSLAMPMYSGSPDSSPAKSHRRARPSLQLDTWKRESSASPTNHASSSGSSSPTKLDRKPPPSLRLDTMGVNPSSLVGKTLRKVTRSARHPTITLQFVDSTAFQIHIEGYHPQPSLQGIPKELEMDSSLDHILSAGRDGQPMDLLISACALVRLTDKAFEKKMREEKWDQNHLGLAFKFAGDPAWHCVWATVVEYDDEAGGCIFRSYDDVYLQPISPSSPRKPRPPGKNKHKTLDSGK